MRSRLLLRIIIYTLIITAFWLGLPQFHYAAALMIALLIRHKDRPGALLEPIDSTTITLPNLSKRNFAYRFVTQKR